MLCGKVIKLSIDYSKYNIRELEDILDNIDGEKFPDRKRDAEIALSELLKHSTTLDDKPGVGKRLMGMVLSIVLAIFCVYILFVAVVDQQILMRRDFISYSRWPVTFWLLVVFWSVCLLVSISWGRKLYRSGNVK